MNERQLCGQSGHYSKYPLGLFGFKDCQMEISFFSSETKMPTTADD